MSEEIDIAREIVRLFYKRWREKRLTPKGRAGRMLRRYSLRSAEYFRTQRSKNMSEPFKSSLFQVLLDGESKHREIGSRTLTHKSGDFCRP